MRNIAYIPNILNDIRIADMNKLSEIAFRMMVTEE